MKKLAASLLFTFAFSMACYAENEQPAQTTAAVPESSITEPSQVNVPQADKEIAAQTTTSAPSAAKPMASPNCSSLPADQQSFAAQLNPSNKTMFCNSFSMDQRKAAMGMVGKPGANGAKMTADDACAKVMKDNNMMPAAPMQPAAPSGTQPATQPKSSGGCPVRQQ